MSEGRKGVKLARFDLIPPKAMWLLAEVYGVGTLKPGIAPRNWEKGWEWSASIAALQRHFWKFVGGESTDPEDGQHHLASVMFHAATLLEYEDTHPELDDRGRKVELVTKCIGYTGEPN